MNSSATVTPLSRGKSNRNAMEEYVFLYERKSEDRYAELRKQDKTLEITKNSYAQSGTPDTGCSSGTSKKRNKQMVEVTQISINGLNLDASASGSTPVNKSKVTSTPLSVKIEDKVKPIIKHTETINRYETIDDASLNDSKTASKKRNKSVSFLLEESDQAIIKKSKSDDLQDAAGDTSIKVKAKKLKYKKINKSEKENKGDGDQIVEKPAKTTSKKKQINNKHDKSDMKQQVNNNNCGDGHSMSVDLPVKLIKDKSDQRPTQEGTPEVVDSKNQIKCEDNLSDRKIKKSKKAKKFYKQPTDQDLETNQQVTKKTKPTKNKRLDKSQNRHEDEPVQKASKKHIQPEIIADNLENLNLGDNAHTITDLLDEMVVVDKTKLKKKRKTVNRLKKKSIDNKDQKPEAKDSVQDMEEPGPEEKKWANKRWNKKQKVREQSIQIIVDNLPIALLFTYKKVLNEHFSKYGPVRTVGIAEVYPTEVPKPVFATTIYFATAEDATKALEEDGATIKGSKIRVFPARPMTETTLVMRSYGPLTEQAIVTGMAGVGKIRSIRPVIRGKKTMSSLFVEFDGPESVEKAIERCKTFKVKTKKVLVDRFTYKNKSEEKTQKDSSVDASRNNKVITPKDSKKSLVENKESPKNSKDTPKHSKVTFMDTSDVGKQEESDSEDDTDSDSDDE